MNAVRKRALKLGAASFLWLGLAAIYPLGVDYRNWQAPHWLVPFTVVFAMPAFLGLLRAFGELWSGRDWKGYPFQPVSRWGEE